MLLFLGWACGPKTAAPSSAPSQESSQTESDATPAPGIQPKPIEDLTPELERMLQDKEPEFHITFQDHYRKIYIVSDRLSYFTFERDANGQPNLAEAKTLVRGHLLSLEEVQKTEKYDPTGIL